MTASLFAALKAKRRRRAGSLFPTPPRKSRRKAKSSPLVLGGATKPASSSPIDLKAGDRVLFGKWSGTEVKIDGEELIIMKESDVMGVLEGAKARRKVA